MDEFWCSVLICTRFISLPKISGLGYLYLDWFLGSAGHFEHLIHVVRLCIKDDTSIEASLQRLGNWVASIWLINSVVSFNV